MAQLKKKKQLRAELMKRHHGPVEEEEEEAGSSSKRREQRQIRNAIGMCEIGLRQRRQRCQRPRQPSWMWKRALPLSLVPTEVCDFGAAMPGTHLRRRLLWSSCYVSERFSGLPKIRNPNRTASGWPEGRGVRFCGPIFHWVSATALFCKIKSTKTEKTSRGKWRILGVARPKRDGCILWVRRKWIHKPNSGCRR